LANATRTRRMAIFIPSYQEDAVILSSAKAALTQKYPTDAYEVIVIADKLKAETITELKSMPIQVVEVAFEKSTKAKALNVALKTIDASQFDIAVILDADNVMKTDFLSRVNARFEENIVALQGRRAAKNGQTGIALLDAASEDINNHILCNGHSAVGLSVRLAGSGMAFDYKVFETIMPQIEAIGGFDKEIELRLTRLGITLNYDPETIVYDEKVGHTNQFSKQRSRWIAAQFRYAKLFIPSAFMRFLLRGQFDHFNKAIQMALPPRLILPFALMLMTVLNLVFQNDTMAFFTFSALTINILSFVLAMPKHYFAVENRAMWLAIPRTLGATFIALTNLREASKRFIHTSHEVIVH
jgi:cellulose synthase/poly-beta-1,6-N-acetylglucosamine synthase-like glycosyltransferase